MCQSFIDNCLLHHCSHYSVRSPYQITCCRLTIHAQSMYQRPKHQPPRLPLPSSPWLLVQPLLLAYPHPHGWRFFGLLSRKWERACQPVQSFCLSEPACQPCQLDSHCSSTCSTAPPCLQHVSLLLPPLKLVKLCCSMLPSLDLCSLSVAVLLGCFAVILFAGLEL
jgi:hypothetical protein